VKRPFRSVRVWSVPSCTSQPPPGRGGFDTASRGASRIPRRSSP
jgi:hypothetical protein